MSKVQLEVLAPLRQHVGNRKLIESQGATVREALNTVARTYPRFKEQIFGSSVDTVRDFINIFLNGEDIRNLDGLETKLKESDRIIIVPAIAGGWSQGSEVVQMTQVQTSPRDLPSYFDNFCERDKPLVWVATTSKDGSPHLVPTCFVKQIADDRIAIGCVFVKQTVRNVLRDPKVTLASVRFTEGYDGYMIKGKAQIHDKGEVFERMKNEIYASTKGRRTIRWVMLVSVEKIYSLKPGEGRKQIK
jgi:MoaD family protein